MSSLPRVRELTGKALRDVRTISKFSSYHLTLLGKERLESALTILMVVVGGALMVALNGMSAGQSAFMNKQMSMLAPNVLFVFHSGQMNFRISPQGPPTIVLGYEVVTRIKSLPFVQEVVPSYQGRLPLNAQGNVLNAQIIAMDPQKIYLVTPSLQLVEGSSMQPNNPTAMLVGDSIANPPGKTTPFVSTGQTVKGTFIM